MCKTSRQKFGEELMKTEVNVEVVHVHGLEDSIQ